MAEVIFHGTRADLMQRLRQLPGILAGTIPDPAGFVEGMQLRLGVQLLSKIQQDFITKSQGGTGEDGIKWPPLSPETIARRRLGPADRKALTIKARAPKLTESQRRKQEKDIRKRAQLMQVKFGMGTKQAMGLARAQVEAAGRKAGLIKSKKAYLSAREVQILIDTSELFRSLSPGVDGPSGAPGQIFKSLPGRVIVGTNKKPWHHRGNARLPARHYWPPGGDLPSSWWDVLMTTYRSGLLVGLERWLAG